jgi:hypothetical protein
MAVDQARYKQSAPAIGYCLSAEFRWHIMMGSHPQNFFIPPNQSRIAYQAGILLSATRRASSKLGNILQDGH